MFHYLADRRPIASLALPHDGVAVLFSRDGQHTLILWTWQWGPQDLSTELYLGPTAAAVDLSGVARPLERHGARVCVPLSPTPLIITGVDAPLVQLQDSLRIEPASIQLDHPEPRPVLMLRNFYDAELTGTIKLSPPAMWEVSPNPISVALAPGQTLEQPLNIELPLRQVAADQQIGVDLHVEHPYPADLHVDIRIQVELRDIVVRAAAWWDGDELVVEQSLQNLSSKPVSFNAFCQVPGRAQLEAAFLDVPAGVADVQQYRFHSARDLAGTSLWTGIREIAGRRSLDQLVVAPE